MLICFIDIVSAVIANIEDLLLAFESKFENAGQTKDITFYVKDKDYSIDCELEDVTQLYSGCVINVILKSNLNERNNNSQNQFNRLDQSDQTKSESQDKCSSDDIVKSKIDDSDSVESKTSDCNMESQVIPSGFYVRMVGVPFYSTAYNVRLFFKGLKFADHSNSIFFVKNMVNHNTGM